ncbi:uncharacterized protein LOC130648504 [Hydractinia symbiolongicarpus]|uniref:uncharacterized protein LOC130648504 n=1 Tax=Hydractinia symbiolongicarpus TaxID=13093 RepID=UPI00254AC099|nr:uncharacterized protein LOC130648504 [Hydractinia symbiolongicarpus]
MDALLNIAPGKSCDTTELRTIFDLIEVHTRNLQSLDVESKAYGPVLISIVMNKLPGDFKLDITRKMPQGTWKIGDLINCFKNELMARALLCTVVTVTARKQIIRAKNRCFNCLKSGHLVRNCNSKNTCFKCKGRHHISLCDAKGGGERNKNNNDGQVPHSQDDEQNQSSNVNVVGCHDSTLLQTANAHLLNTDKNSVVFSGCVLFDNCSQKSFITSNAKQRSKLKIIRSEILNVKVFGDNSEKPRKLDVVKVKIKNAHSNDYSVIEAYVMDMICSPLSNQRVDLAQTLLPNICLADNNASDKKQIDVLIGANYYWNFVTGQIIKTENALTAVQTILGWTLNGNVRVSSSTVNVANVLLSHKGHELSTDNLKKFWQVEDINEVDTTFTIGKFSEKIDFDGERYSVPLPWKQDHEQIPDNFQNSRNRLTSVFRRLKAKAELLQQYDDIIKQQKCDGIIEQVTEPPPPPGKVHYLRHHYVLKEDKSTTKVRIVYDASSNSPSLNDCLEKGPSLLPLLMDILIRFGTYKVAVASDIKQAFLNVANNTPDRDLLRFLWFDDITKENP